MEKRYCVLNIGHGIEGGFYDTIDEAVDKLNKLVEALLAQGWYQIHHEGEGKYTFIVITRNFGEVIGRSVSAFQIKEVEI